MDIQAALYERVLIWAMDVDPDDCRKEIEWRRRRNPELSNRKLGRQMMLEYSLLSLGEGALTALASGPVLAIPAALVDTAFILRMAARLNGCMGLLANPEYFSDDRWRADAVALIGNDPVTQQGARRTALQVTNRVALQLASRAGVRRLIPVLGGIVGGAWNFLEIRALAARIFDYHFDDSVSDDPTPSPAAAHAPPAAMADQSESDSAPTPAPAEAAEPMQTAAAAPSSTKPRRTRGAASADDGATSASPRSRSGSRTRKSK